MFFNLSGKSFISFIILFKSAKVGQSNSSFHFLNVLPPNHLGKFANALITPYNTLQIIITIVRITAIITVKSKARILRTNQRICITGINERKTGLNKNNIIQNKK